MSELLIKIVALMSATQNKYADSYDIESAWTAAVVELLVEIRDDNNVPMEHSLIADGLLKTRENFE